MVDEELAGQIDSYIQQNWEQVIKDLDSLVSIESTEDLSKSQPGAPYGPGPKASLQCALDLAEKYGFEPHNCEGYIGYADWPGESEKQIASICHTDVVPAGPGWNYPPFQVTRDKGYLIGRGVADDKGPLIVALHALAFWRDRIERFPYTFRMIFGANEETGMHDLAYYRERFDDPDILFTPDHQFPVGYGEKGVFQATITSKSITDGAIEEFSGGTASNAVAGQAHAVLRAQMRDLPLPGGGITTTDKGDGRVLVEAMGIQAHAAYPQRGLNAIGLLVGYLLKSGVCSRDEMEWLDFLQHMVASTDGAFVGLASSDKDFGPLTMTCGKARKEEDRFTQTLDIRFTTQTSAEQVEEKVASAVALIGASVHVDTMMPPFLMDVEGPFIQALLSSYRDVTGDMQEPLTSGGATYAREFETMAASFGMQRNGEDKPAWVGDMHEADEGAYEGDLKEALKIYIIAIQRLMELKI